MAVRDNRDNKGRKIYRSVKKEEKGWGVNVWPAHAEALNQGVRRWYYKTRDQARCAHHTDRVGIFGRIA